MQKQISIDNAQVGDSIELNGKLGEVFGVSPLNKSLNIRWKLGGTSIIRLLDPIGEFVRIHARISREVQEDSPLFDLLSKSGAIIEGHYFLSSGRHTDKYIEKCRILENPIFLEEFCKPIAEEFKDENPHFIAGGSLGGNLIAYELARMLGVRAIFVEKISEHSDFFIRRGQTDFIHKNARILVVDDVFTTGKSLAKVTTLLQGWGGIIGKAVLINRSPNTPLISLSPRFFASLNFPIKSYLPDQIPSWLKVRPLGPL